MALVAWLSRVTQVGCSPGLFLSDSDRPSGGAKHTDLELSLTTFVRWRVQNCTVTQGP